VAVAGFMCAPVGAVALQSHVHASPVCARARLLPFEGFHLLLPVLILMCSCVCRRFASGGGLGFSLPLFFVVVCSSVCALYM
jgi:hypothetical protein